MSADGKVTGCQASGKIDEKQNDTEQTDESEKNVERTKKIRKVSFPDEQALVTQYFEPANPWHDVPSTTRSQLAAEYLEACRVHHTPPIDSVLDQIRELPENCIGGSTRASRLALAECALLGTAPADALEALLRKVQFRRVEIDHVELDDEGAEAIFDMLEYYESATAVCISGPRQYGIRGWQAACRMIKKSAELSELEISESPLEAAHAPVLARALRPLACRLRSLCLQRAALSGEPLLCLVIALKSNSSVRELRLGDNGLTAADAAQLAALLRYNTRLQLLDLSNNHIQDLGVSHLADALVEQAAQTPPEHHLLSQHTHGQHVAVGGYDTRGLGFLVLWNNQLTRNCAQYLAKVLRSSQSLCVLNAGRNALGAETVRALAAGPPGAGPPGGGTAPHSVGPLVSLGLQAARLGSDAAHALGELVRVETRLQRLDLRDNKLGAEGLRALAAGLLHNRTLSQIDLDDPPDTDPPSPLRQLVEEVRALCRRNEPAAPPAPDRDRLLRKISLTCHTHAHAHAAPRPHYNKPSPEEERRSRLRSPLPSPAPSPAGSPVPTAPTPAGSRFCVTRVTPERDTSSDSSCSSPSPSPCTPPAPPAPPAPRPPGSPSPSRFRVVQVAEPPKIQVHPATQPRKPSSRFSVTRNYDAIYNPTVASPTVGVSPTPPRPDSSMSDPGVTETGISKGGEDTELASTPDSVKSDSEVSRYSLTVGTPVNIARFRVTKTNDDPVVAERVNNSRFTVSKPIDVQSAVVERKIKTGDSKSSDFTNKRDEVKATDKKGNVDVKKTDEKDVSKAEIKADVVKDSVESSKNVAITTTNVPESNVDVKCTDTLLHSNKIQTLTEKKVEDDTREKESHLQIVTIPPKNDDKIINMPVLLDKSMIEAPSIEHKKAIESFNVTYTVPLNLESKLLEETTSKTATDVSDIQAKKELLESTDKIKAVDDNACVKNKKDASKKLEVIKEVPIPVIVKKNDDAADKTADIKSNIEDRDKSDLKVVKFDNVSVKNDKIDLKSVVKIDKSDESVIRDTSEKPVLCDVNTGSVKNRTDDKDNLKDKDIDNVKDISLAKTVSDAVVDHTVCEKDSFSDKTEEVSHNEMVTQVGDDLVLKNETQLVKNSVEINETDIVDVDVKVTVKRETVCSVKDIAKVHCDQNVCNVNKYSDFKDVDSSVCVEKGDGAVIKQIEAITENLGNLIQEMQDFSCKTRHVKNDSTQTDNCNVDAYNIVPGSIARDSVVLKKNKSESSLDSPDLEVSRLMKRKPDSAFCDSSSSLEISGSSMESLNAGENRARPIVIQESVESDTELDRRRDLSTESSIESTSEVTPVNILNMSVSSNESVSPIIFGGKKLHGSLSSLEASVSSLESRLEKVMVTSADSGIEYSLQNPSENRDDTSSNEGTLTHNSSLRETVKKDCFQETLTSPKRTNSLLDVPAMKSKGLERMRKISWVPPSASFHVAKPEPDRVEMKLQSNLEKLLSLFQHPSSLFSRSQGDDEKKSASNTPPRKDSSLTSSFWSWGSSTDKSEKDDKEDRDSLSEATDSTLSERVQVSFVDESFSKKLDSKTPSTDTNNTLSEFQSFPQSNDAETERIAEEDRKTEAVTDLTTDDNLVQKSLVLSVKSTESASSNGNSEPRACDNIDLIMPNDLNKNVYDDVPATEKQPSLENVSAGDKAKLEVKEEIHMDPVRPRTFAAVLKSSGSENSMEKQNSPDTGQPVDKLPNKVIRGIKENISPENTLTASMSTKALAYELDKQVNPVNVNIVYQTVALEKPDTKLDEAKTQSDLAPIATIDETCDEAADNCIQLAYIDDVKIIDDPIERDIDMLEEDDYAKGKTLVLENVDLGKDALSYLTYENLDFEPDTKHLISDVKSQQGSLADELKDAEIKEQLLDLSPELVIDEALEMPEVFPLELKGMMTSIPERAKKKSNSLEDLSQREQIGKDSPKTKTIAFKVPESTTPRDIPERRPKLRSRSGSSPKSLPESLNKPSPLAKMETSKKKKKVSSLGKIARDSLLALNMSEEEIAEFRRSYKLTSVESLKSLESVSEDANSQSGTSFDSRCRACLRLSQESLMSLDSINEDCKCLEDCDKRAGHSNR